MRITPLLMLQTLPWRQKPYEMLQAVFGDNYFSP